MRFAQFLILFISFTLSAQDLSLVKSVPMESDYYIGVDTHGSMYAITNNILAKTSTEAKYIFNDLLLGPISSVDIVNPLKIVVFYEDTNTVLFLDNRLNEIERINFNQLQEFLTVSQASNAGSNRLWIFNSDTQQLELYNYRENRKTTVSQPFAGEVLSQQSDFNYCSTLTEKKLRLFNSYGSLISETEVQDFEKITYANRKVIGLKENALYWFTNASDGALKNSFEPIKLPISENTIKDLQLTKEFLYIYDGKILHTFSISQTK